jgi:hypothetical protein
LGALALFTATSLEDILAQSPTVVTNEPIVATRVAVYPFTNPPKGIAITPQGYVLTAAAKSTSADLWPFVLNSPANYSFFNSGNVADIGMGGPNQVLECNTNGVVFAVTYDGSNKTNIVSKEQITSLPNAVTAIGDAFIIDGNAYVGFATTNTVGIQRLTDGTTIQQY